MDKTKFGNLWPLIIICWGQGLFPIPGAILEKNLPVAWSNFFCSETMLRTFLRHRKNFYVSLTIILVTVPIEYVIYKKMGTSLSWLFFFNGLYALSILHHLIQMMRHRPDKDRLAIIRQFAGDIGFLLGCVIADRDPSISLPDFLKGRRDAAKQMLGDPTIFRKFDVFGEVKRAFVFIAFRVLQEDAKAKAAGESAREGWSYRKEPWRDLLELLNQTAVRLELRPKRLDDIFAEAEKMFNRADAPTEAPAESEKKPDPVLVAA